jgi:hypothetical protein
LHGEIADLDGRDDGFRQQLGIFLLDHGLHIFPVDLCRCGIVPLVFV